MNDHFAETRNQINKGLVSDSFAKHFASHFKTVSKNSQISSGDIRKITKVSILWQGNPISSMKTFGKINCNLCMMERMEILKAKKLDELNGEHKLINSSKELYGACRHKTKFHRYRSFKKPISTDEGCINPERSEQIASDDTQELSQSLAQMSLHSPVMCTPVPADRINGQIVMDL